MAISIYCTGCSKKLQAPDAMAGKRARCPHCKAVVELPAATPPVIAAAPVPALDDLLDDVLATSSTSQPADNPYLAQPGAFATEQYDAPRQSVLSERRVSTASSAARFSPTDDDASTALFGRFGYLVFAVVLAPLTFSLLLSGDDIAARLKSTQERHAKVFEEIDADEQATSEDLFAALPDHRIDGAFLPRETWAHWIFAAMSVGAFFAMFWLIFERGPANPGHLMGVALCTATAGIVSLLIFQVAAQFTQGFWLRGGGVVTILFYIVKFIGWSYAAASDPENGFWLSFIGFVCAVGLCEELTKAIPLLSRMGKMEALGWRGMCQWGLATGMGFGVAEGIMYCGDHYNGIATGNIYLVRFISCVGLHAIWSGAVGISIWKVRENFDTREYSDLLVPLLKVLAIPILLHGLYDTLLKRDMNLGALAIAVASFVWLVWQIETARAMDDEYESQPTRMASAG